MRSLLVITLLLMAGLSLAQKHPSAVLRSIMKANDAGFPDDVRDLLWSKANKDDIVKTLEKAKEAYGPVNYFLQTDSAYRTSKSQPKKYYEFRFNAYHQKDLLKYEFIMVEEKNGYRLASLIVHAYKGNYNDPLMNYGTITVPKLFITNIMSGKAKESYSLFSQALTEEITETGFLGMADVIVESIGELKAVDFLDTCTALNFYGANENIGMFAVKLTGSKGEFYFTGSIAMTNDGTFFITRFQLFENIEINNLNEIKAAETIVDEFYFNLSNGSYDKLYSLLHKDLQERQSLADITQVLEGVKNAAGRHKAHSVESQIFARNKKASELNKFMLVVRNENERKLMHDNFILSYDMDNNLRISYFYFVEY